MKKHVLLFASIAALAGILFGFDTGVISGAILFINDEFHLTPLSNGVVTSSVLLGAFIGSLFSGRLTDILGRKYFLMFTAIIFIVGTIMTTFAASVGFLIFGRLVVGVGIGVASYIAPLYISEISPMQYRGAFVTLNQLSITIGILLSFLVDYLFSLVGSWRWMFFCGIFPAIVLFLGLFLLPQSPRWLMHVGREEKAKRVLMTIRTNPKEIEEEMQAMHDISTMHKATWKDLFESNVRKSLYIGIFLAVIQQLVGINAILYYAPTIFENSGFHQKTGAILSGLGVGIVNTLATIVAIPLLDRLGRKPLIYAGMGIMAIGLIFLFCAMELFHAKYFVVWSIMIYILGFAISLGPITWLMIVEIFPLHIRGLGSSICTACNWASNWLVSLTFLSIAQAISLPYTFFIYLFFIAVGTWITFLYVPETKCVSLEVIENNLYSGKKARDIGI